MIKKPLIIISGPTATGKSHLAVELAKRINGSIISADSMQVYKYMDIGSAKITPEEMDGIPHYLVDELLPSEEFHVQRFQEMSKAALLDIYAKGRIPLIVGGTGFYIQALLYDIDFTDEEKDSEYEAYLDEVLQSGGEDALFKLLEECDPLSTTIIHKNNTKRVKRALIFHHIHNKPISLHNKEQQEKESIYNFAYFALTDRREVLYDKIDKRVDIMVDSGLIDEVTSLKNMGYHKDMVSMQGLGYKEILDYLDGKISLDEAIYIIKRDTRHFAKRQLTWLRREKDVIFFDKSNYEDKELMMDNIIKDMISILQDKNII